ncbi:hypothetical protein [Inquilinus sp. OTU3971]|uniref:hypothetical protein n=1 Tax=Inquilinus sp. OTU3971 TaxID=3043855 RepID=UPI00313DD4CA
MVWKLDRFGWLAAASDRDGCSVLGKRGIASRSLIDGIDMAVPNGRLTLQLS